MNTTISKNNNNTQTKNILTHKETHISKHCAEVLQQSKQEVG